MYLSQTENHFTEDIKNQCTVYGTVTKAYIVDDVPMTLSLHAASHPRYSRSKLMFP